jgi:hypothetical protein
LVATVIDDAIGLASLASGVPLPGGATAGAVVSDYLRRRYDKTRDLVLEELRAGRVDVFEAASADDAIAITLRIMRAAREGTARLNLRLLAKAVAGQAQRGALVADEFLPYADILAPLSRDEIVLIATLYRHWLDVQDPSKASGGSPYERAKRELEKKGIFPSDTHMHAVGARAQRSGLIYPLGTMATRFEISPLMIELAKLVDFQDALRREGVKV